MSYIISFSVVALAILIFTLTVAGFNMMWERRHRADDDEDGTE
jgi:hypothetical protein